MSRAATGRAQLGWALYDWANSAFATTVVAGFFPIFFKTYWSADHAAETSTLQLGVGSALASPIVLFLAPLLGAIADPFGEAEAEVICDEAGIVIGRSNMPVVYEGEALFHVASTPRGGSDSGAPPSTY